MWRLALILSLGLCSCGPDFSEAGLGTDIPFTPDRPTVPTGDAVAPYLGSDPYVQDAQERFRTGLDVHRKIVWRTCTPNDGVCHNAKEYPDLHTPANFLAAIDAPCNVQPGEYESVYDRCERPGDRFKLDFWADFGPSIEVGWIELITAVEDADPTSGELGMSTPGLHVHLKEPVRIEQTEVWARGQFLRTVVEQGDVVFAQFETTWRVLDGGTHLIAEVRNYQTDRAAELMRLGIRQGDLNRNGTFGADQDAIVPMIKRGDPERSYLIARVRGEMDGLRVPGSRMPLANQPLSIEEMLALFCFVEGLPGEGMPDLAAPVDYKNCSYSVDPGSLNLLGEGVTWKSRVSKILEANCGGCHGGPSPDADLNLVGDTAYERLLGDSIQKPEMKLIVPGDFENSYLWWKLTNHKDIVGLPMPFNPLTGEGSLQEAELGDISTWIAAGAIENE
ncbi:MAG: hypothetical protein R3E66_09165 [bacterium]